MSRVDVVVPCYNYGRFLKQCVESILGQEGVDVRVLIIDDASSDDTIHVGQHFSLIDPRVEFRRHDVNQGHIATYNEGLLEWASSEYSLLLSADDALAPGALARATQLMDCHSEVGMTYGMVLIILDDETPKAAIEQASGDYRIVSGSKFLQFCFAHTFNPVPTPVAVVRTELQRYLGGYCAELPHTGDYEMWLRFAVHASIGVLRDVQGYYRWHKANMSSHYYNQVLADRRELLQAGKGVIERWGAQFPESGLWFELWSQELAKEACGMASKGLLAGDAERFRAWLRFAEEIYPGLRGSGFWWRLQTKRLVGPALLQRIRPVLNRLRGIRETPSEFAEFQTGQQFGWWPGS